MDVIQCVFDSRCSFMLSRWHERRQNKRNHGGLEVGKPQNIKNTARSTRIIRAYGTSLKKGDTELERTSEFIEHHGEMSHHPTPAVCASRRARSLVAGLARRSAAEASAVRLHRLLSLAVDRDNWSCYSSLQDTDRQKESVGKSVLYPKTPP